MTTPSTRKSASLEIDAPKRKGARLEIDAPPTKRLTIRAIDDQSVVDEIRQKGGKSERETRTSGGKSMGGAISKCGDTVVDEVIDEGNKDEWGQIYGWRYQQMW